MAIEENWDTEQIDLMIDNTFNLYEAKQKLLWSVTQRVTPFDAARFVKGWRPTLESEFRAQRMTLNWGAVQYDILAATWTREMADLRPRTVAQAIHLAENVAANWRAEIPIPDDDKFRDMSPFKALEKGLGHGFEFDCAALQLCIEMKLDISRVKMPMPADYSDED